MQQLDPYDDLDDDLEEPVQLLYWSVRELPNGSKRLVGSIRARGGFSTRVSSALTTLDLKARTATSGRGRTYLLVGRRGGTLEADSRWWHYCGKVGSETGIDITDALIDGLQDQDIADSMRAPREGNLSTKQCNSSSHDHAR